LTNRLAVNAERPDMPWLLTSLVSERKIISDLRLVIPYTLSLWDCELVVDMLRELQLIADTVISGMRRGKAGIMRQLRKLRRIASSVEAKRHRWPKAIDYR
jgi:hypothetical protein